MHVVIYFFEYVLLCDAIIRIDKISLWLYKCIKWINIKKVLNNFLMLIIKIYINMSEK